MAHFYEIIFLHHYMDITPFSNGFTEGINNKIKVLKRIAFGFKNFKRFRGRILLLSKVKLN